MGRTVTLTRRGNADRRRAAIDALTAASVLPTFEMTQGSPASKVFVEAYLDAGYTEMSYDVWPCEERLADGGPVVFRDDNEAVYRLDDGTFVQVELNYGMLRLRVAGASRAALGAATLAFRAAYPTTYLTATDERVPITFWAMGPHGPVPHMRKIDAQPWATIAANYPPDVRAELEAMMVGFEPGRDGQLSLWQGPPGTGKTWALRALASEWLPWAEFHYITDPDAFFVDQASYMIDVLLADTYMAVDEPTGDVFEGEEGENGRWRVLILEDTGELLSVNAKERYGQGLARLLNVVDGMIGQGLRVLVLVTTNDELGELNPAVRRPGRCAAQIVFRELSPEEAAEWAGGDVDAPATLAELYARSRDGKDALPDEPVVASGHVHEWGTIEGGFIYCGSSGCLWRLAISDAEAADFIWATGDTEIAGRLAAASSDLVSAIAKVAAEHQPGEPAYGEAAWNADTRTVLWVAWDGTSRDEVEAAEAAFLAVDGVEAFEYEFEALPAGWWDAVVVYPENPPRWAVEQHAVSVEELVELARAPLAPEREVLAAVRAAVPDLTAEEESLLSEGLRTLAAVHRQSVDGVSTLVASAAKERDQDASERLTFALVDALGKFAARPEPAPAPIHVHVPNTELSVNVEGATVNVPEQPAPVVHVHEAEHHVGGVVVNVPAAKPQPIVVQVPEQPAPVVHVAAAEAPVVHVHEREQRPRAVRVEYDDDGTKRFVPEDLPA